MRKGFDGLPLLVQEALRRDPHCGHLFVFRGAAGARALHLALAGRRHGCDHAGAARLSAGRDRLASTGRRQPGDCDSLTHVADCACESLAQSGGQFLFHLVSRL